jgi:hypothetical protein
LKEMRCIKQRQSDGKEGPDYQIQHQPTNG